MKKLIAFMLGTKYQTTAPTSPAWQALQRQRETIHGLIDKATQNGDGDAITKHYNELTEANKSIAEINRLNGKFSNLY